MRLFDYDPDIFMEDWIASGKIKPKEDKNEGNHNNSNNLCNIGGNMLDKQG